MGDVELDELDIVLGQQPAPKALDDLVEPSRGRRNHRDSDGTPLPGILVVDLGGGQLHPSAQVGENRAKTAALLLERSACGNAQLDEDGDGVHGTQGRCSRDTNMLDRNLATGDC